MTAIPRREFMAQASAASVVGAAAVAEAGNIGRDPFPVEQFEELVGTTFTVMADGRPAARLKLDSVKRLGPAAQPQFRAPYSLLFKAPADFDLQQDVYRLSHSQLTTFKHLLVPIVNRGNEPLLEAVFN